MQPIKLIVSFRINEGSKQRPEWSDWMWETSAPITNPLGVANIINGLNEKQHAFKGSCEYKVEVGRIGKGGVITPATEDELLDLTL